MPPIQDAAERASAAEPKALASGPAVSLPAGTGTRIDQAHTLGAGLTSPLNRRALPGGDELPDAEPAGPGLAEGPVQLEAQAAQLAALLEQRQLELVLRETQLDRREADFAQEVREARFRLSQRRRQTDRQQAARQRVLRRQSERLDRRRAAIDESRRQAAQMRQDALELRLVTEQLHAQLARSIAPSSLSASLDQLRQRLADHHRQEIRELTRQRAELELLKAELADQYEKLMRLTGNERGDESPLP
ncbi:MAG TPA: hypothetical protein VFW87_19510 [Pirellulales bacterium]|nr:hypothetical protein [Pirellulales bacterium]